MAQIARLLQHRPEIEVSNAGHVMQQIILKAGAADDPLCSGELLWHMPGSS